jgi:CheY-like chemotaxis protein
MNQEQRTILIAEDSPTQATSLQDLLESQGLCVLCAFDGPQALDMAQEHQPDVIVLDIEMPGMSGLEVAANLSREPRTQNIPIILLTTHDSSKMAQKGFILGAVDFIPKDIFAQAVLLETLRQLGVLNPD